MTTKKAPDTATNTQPGQGAKEAEEKEPAKDSAAKDGTSNAKGKQGDKGKRDVLLVSARGESFRRAGRQFGRQPRILYVDQLSEAEIEAIKAEPRLVVVDDQVDDQVEDEGEE